MFRSACLCLCYIIYMQNIRVITYLDKIDKKFDILQSTCKKYNINLEILIAYLNK